MKNKKQVEGELTLLTQVLNNISFEVVNEITEDINEIIEGTEDVSTKALTLKKLKKDNEALFQKIRDMKRILKSVKDDFLGKLEKETIGKIDNFIKSTKEKAEYEVVLKCADCGSTKIEKWSLKK